MSDDLSELSMLELFRLEADTQIQTLTSALLELERTPESRGLLESCMRAAHSLKGAARIVDLDPVVAVTHGLEDCFVAAQRGQCVLGKREIDLLLRGVDLLTKLVADQASQPEAAAFVSSLGQALAATPSPVSVEPSQKAGALARAQPEPRAGERVLRVTAQSFDRLLGLAAEALVESRRLSPFAASLLKLKRVQHDAGKALEGLREALTDASLSASSRQEQATAALSAARGRLLECQALLGDRLLELETFERRAGNVAHRLYGETLRCRMRPFADGVQGFARMVRDLADGLGKRARLEIVGESTQVDRDVLEKLDGPLTHLLRNAVDHGIDPPAARRAAGKAEEGVVRLEARHAGGMLQLSVSDDGQGVDIPSLRAAVLARGLSDTATVAKLADAELYEFLFLPGFTLRDKVTDVSGRGVGLDAVQAFAKQLRGSVRVSSQPGSGTRFELQLPLTVSVVRTLLVEIGAEPYAFPLAQVERALTIPASDVQTVEGLPHIAYAGRQLGLASAQQIFKGDQGAGSAQLHVLVLADRDGAYGLVVERFLGASELVIQTLDPRLGKIKDIAAGALLADGTPVLIVDVDDLLRSIQKLIASGQLGKVRYDAGDDKQVRAKRVLVVDDSLTVRELERKLLERGGYEVEVAVDGVDGWNAVRGSSFDLLVTDIDMPRMDGIELLQLIRKDARLAALPVMIVSYKDREEDRRRGLDAGADFYLAKTSFHSEALVQAVTELIGAP